MPDKDKDKKKKRRRRPSETQRADATRVARRPPPRRPDLSALLGAEAQRPDVLDVLPTPVRSNEPTPEQRARSEAFRRLAPVGEFLKELVTVSPAEHARQAFGGGRAGEASAAAIGALPVIGDVQAVADVPGLLGSGHPNLALLSALSALPLLGSMLDPVAQNMIRAFREGVPPTRPFLPEFGGPPRPAGFDIGERPYVESRPPNVLGGDAYDIQVRQAESARQLGELQAQAIRDAHGGKAPRVKYATMYDRRTGETYRGLDHAQASFEARKAGANSRDLEAGFELVTGERIDRPTASFLLGTPISEEMPDLGGYDPVAARERRIANMERRIQQREAPTPPELTPEQRAAEVYHGGDPREGGFITKEGDYIPLRGDIHLDVAQRAMGNARRSALPDFLKRGNIRYTSEIDESGQILLNVEAHGPLTDAQKTRISQLVGREGGYATIEYVRPRRKPVYRTQEIRNGGQLRRMFNDLEQEAFPNAAAPPAEPPKPPARPVASGTPDPGDVPVDAALAYRDFQGFTYDPRTGQNVGASGKYAVSPFKMREQVLDHAPTPEDIATFMEQNADLFEDPNVYVGGWQDGERHVLDATVLTDDAAQAERIARATGQDGFTHLDGKDFTTTRIENVDPIEAARARDQLIDEMPAFRTAMERSMMENLTPAERASYQRQRPDAQRKWLEAFAKSPMPREWASMIGLGFPQRDFYALSRAALAQFGEDAPKFTALLAATSPNVGVDDNMRIALAVWEGTGGQPVSRRQLSRLVTSAGGVPSAVANVEKILAMSSDEIAKLDLTKPGFLSGPKVDPFFANLMGETQRLTLDTHMARSVGTLPGSYIGTLGRNGGVAASIRAGANEFNRLTGQSISPIQAQAAIWSPTRTMTELLQRGEPVNPASISFLTEASDFGQLLQQPELQQAAQRAGFPAVTPAEMAPTPTLPEGLVRPEDVAGIGQRIQLTKGAQAGLNPALFTFPLAIGLGAGAMGLLGGNPEEERRRQAFAQGLLLRQ